MQEFEIPIIKKVYDLYKDFHGLRAKISKTDRYTIFLKCDNSLLELLNDLLEASQTHKAEKLLPLERASRKISFLRILFRLLKDTGSINLEIYSAFEERIDEMGRMLGGWIKSSRN